MGSVYVYGWLVVEAHVRGSVADHISCSASDMSLGRCLLLARRVLGRLHGALARLAHAVGAVLNCALGAGLGLAKVQSSHIGQWVESVGGGLRVVVPYA